MGGWPSRVRLACDPAERNVDTRRSPAISPALSPGTTVTNWKWRGSRLPSTRVIAPPEAQPVRSVSSKAGRPQRASRFGRFMPYTPWTPIDMRTLSRAPEDSRAKRPRRLVTVSHSSVVPLNRRLANELARVGGGDWDVTAVAPRFSHGDLSPPHAQGRAGRARPRGGRARPVQPLAARLRLRTGIARAPLRRRGLGALVGGAGRRSLVHGRGGALTVKAGCRAGCRRARRRGLSRAAPSRA